MRLSVFRHTHELTDSLARELANKGIPFEVDLSINGNELYVGHPASWYENTKHERPELIATDDLRQLLKDEKPAYVIDVKDYETIDLIVDMVRSVDHVPLYIHAFAETLVLDVDEVFNEPQRFNENISDENLERLRSELGTSIIVSSRVVYDPKNDREYIKRLESMNDSYDVVNFNAPYATYSEIFLAYLQQKGKKILQNLDMDSVLRFDVVGVTDDTDTALRFMNGTL